MNLFYLKTAFDYLIGYQIMETMSPGTLRRIERRMKKKKMLKGSFTKGIKESMNNFSREEFIKEDNVDILGQIIRKKQAMPLKFKDGQMKIDMQTANAILKNLVNAPANFMKGSTRTKVMDIINKGKKATK